MKTSQRRPRSAESRERAAEVARRTWADPEIRARRLAGLKKAWADPAQRAQMSAKRSGPRGPYKPRDVAVPAWVPPDLRDVFVEIGQARGEEAAASHVRKVKRERADANQ